MSDERQGMPAGHGKGSDGHPVVPPGRDEHSLLVIPRATSKVTTGGVPAGCDEPIAGYPPSGLGGGDGHPTNPLAGVTTPRREAGRAPYATLSSRERRGQERGAIPPDQDSAATSA